MWFFDNTRALGIIFWVVALLQLVAGALLAVTPFFDDTLEYKEFYYITGAGLVAASLIYIWNADKVMRNVYPKRITILAKYIAVVGVNSMIIWGTTALAIYVCGEETDLWMTVAFIGIALGLVLLLVSFKIEKGRKGIVKKTIWVITVLVFLLMGIYSLTPLEVSDLEIISKIAHLLIAIFMLVLLSTAEVRSEMGFNVNFTQYLEQDGEKDD